MSFGDVCACCGVVNILFTSGPFHETLFFLGRINLIKSNLRCKDAIMRIRKNYVILPASRKRAKTMKFCQLDHPSADHQSDGLTHIVALSQLKQSNFDDFMKKSKNYEDVPTS